MKAHFIVWLFALITLGMTIPLQANPQNSALFGTGLAFEQRVAAQEAIERVYYAHRIWPKENPGPKPLFEQMISKKQLEARVEDYLEKSAALEGFQQGPITARQLQAEMDRMAQNTHDADTLLELFSALGNNPYLIAECLARPILAERLIHDIHATAAGTFSGRDFRARRSSQIPEDGGGFPYAVPVLGSAGDSSSQAGWIPCAINTNAPPARGSITAVWTGAEMIIWGGLDFDNNFYNSGGRYSPATDSWTSTSTGTDVPIGRNYHTAVWTGTEMIVWGGCSLINEEENTGGRYNPLTDSWKATSTGAGTPTARNYHMAVWTGLEMIIWGGFSFPDDLNTGGRYNPATDSWLPTSTASPVPYPRETAAAVWTGTEMIIWGGYTVYGDNSRLNTGGRYNPNSDSWTSTSTGANVPEGNVYPEFVWTGKELIVWGGYDEANLCRNSGGRYDPATDSWAATSIGVGVPSARAAYSAVWTGTEMIVWGGGDFSMAFNTGGRYNPSTDTWIPMSMGANVPVARYFHKAVWTGTEMIVYGGSDWAGNNINTGGCYVPAGSSHVRPVSPP